MKVLPPDSEAVLMERAAAIAGKTLQQIANLQQTVLPEQLTGAKGHIGELLENYLGASAGSLPEPDFRNIGVELKTLPIGQNGKPKESTFVCTVSLLPGDSSRWEDSLVKRKLSRANICKSGPRRKMPDHYDRALMPMVTSSRHCHGVSI